MSRPRLKQLRTFEHLRDIQGELLAALLLCCDIRIPADHVDSIILPVEFYLTFRLLSRTHYESFAQSVHTAQLCFIKLYRVLFRLPSRVALSKGWSRCRCGTRVKHRNFGNHLRKCALWIDLDAQECCYIESQAQGFDRATLCDRSVRKRGEYPRIFWQLKNPPPRRTVNLEGRIMGGLYAAAFVLLTYQFLRS